MKVRPKKNLGVELFNYFQAGMTNAETLLRANLAESVSTPGPPRSEPGEPPHIDKGPLHDTIESVHAYHSYTRELEFAVGATQPYASTLELGGLNDQGFYVAPRPFILPTFLASIDDVKNLLLEDVDIPF